MSSTKRGITAAAAALLIGLTIPLPAQTTLVEDNNGITGFELTRYGLYYWESRRTCAGGGSDTIKQIDNRTIASPAFTTITARCDEISANSNVARGSEYYHYFDDGTLKRKNSYYPDTGTGASTSISYSAPEIPGPVTRGPAGRVYWAVRNGSTEYEIWSCNVFGMDQQLEHSDTTSAGHNVVRKLVVDTYTTAGGERKGLIWLVGDALGGELLVKEVGSTSAPRSLSFYITDFNYCENLGTLGDRIFAARNETLIKSGGIETKGTFGGSVMMANPASSSMVELFNDIGASIVSVAADANNYYWMESGDWEIKRRAHGSGVTPATILSVEATEMGNLRSDGERLYFLRNSATTGHRIQYISTGAAPVQLDLIANGVEPIQTTQILSPSASNPKVWLVAGRDVYVRGYATIGTNTTGEESWRTAASLRMKVNGTDVEVLPRAYARIDANTGPANTRGNGSFDNTFLFIVPGQYVKPGTMEFRMIVNEFNTTPETGTRTNNESVMTVDVVDMGRPTIAFKAVNHRDHPNLRMRNIPRLGQILARTKAMTPYADVRFREADGLLSKLVITPNPFELFHRWDPFNFPGDQTNALVHLSIDQIFHNWIGGTLPVGMIHPDVENFNGLGSPLTGCLVRMAWNEGSDYGFPLAGRTLAHEWGHVNFQYHVHNTACGQVPDGPYASYPYDPCNIGPDDPLAYFGFDPITRAVIAPTAAGDLMSYRTPRWTSPYTWSNWRSPDLIPDFKESVEKGITTGAQLIVVGEYDPANDAMELRNLYVVDADFFPASSLKRLEQKQQELARLPDRDIIRRYDSGGALIGESLFEALPIAEGNGNELVFAITPFEPSVDRVEVLIADTVKETVQRSPNAPSVSVGMARYDGTAETLSISFAYSDADDDVLETAILFSNDNGATWIPIAAEYPYFAITTDARNLPGGGSTCRFAVMVTDGLNTTTRLSAPFALPRRAPEAMIDGVLEGEQLRFGTRREVYGLALDPDDGSLPNESLQWYLSGAMQMEYTGSAITLEGLIPGDYQLKLVGTDSDAETATAVVNFSVSDVAISYGGLPVLDGYSDVAYDQALSIRIPFGESDFAEARMLLASGDYYIYIDGLPQASGNPTTYTGINIDANKSGDATAQTDDRAFLVSEYGLTAQMVGNGSGIFATTSNPVEGFEAMVVRTSDRYAVEMRLDAELFGGLDSGFRFMFGNYQLGKSLPDMLWPPEADFDSPATWAPAMLGPTLPQAPLVKPVANAGGDIHMILADEQKIFLDGTGSYNPNDKGTISYSWKQLEGEPVMLENDDSNMPSFTAVPSDKMQNFRFELTVTGTGGTAIDEVLIGLLPRPDPYSAPTMWIITGGGNNE